MITVLNFCHHDRDQAFNLLRWIGELGNVKAHTLVLQCNGQAYREGMQKDLIAEAEKSFNTVKLHVPYTEDERGWPQSPNHAWLEAVLHMRKMFADMPQSPDAPLGWLWLEPDCVPLKSSWLNKIEADYKAAKKPFMAAEVIHPIRRLSGIAVYPAVVSKYLRHRRFSDMAVFSEKGAAWDQYYSPEWMEFTHFTNLIQNVHFQSRNPDVAPTFPNEESLNTIDPDAVLFHRCKDGTLIDQLRMKLPPPAYTEAPVVTVSTAMGGGATAQAIPVKSDLEVENERLRNALAQAEKMKTERQLEKSKKVKNSAWTPERRAEASKLAKERLAKKKAAITMDSL